MKIIALKEYRIKKGLSRRDLAEIAGVTERHIAFIENGDRLPSLDVALKIASAVGQTIEKIFKISSTNSSKEKL
mgnify:CR=1 FL=1